MPWAFHSTAFREMFLASLTVFQKIGTYSRFHSTAADTSTHWVPILDWYCCDPNFAKNASSRPARIVNAQLNICLLVQIDIRYDGLSFSVTNRVESSTFSIQYGSENSDNRLPIVSRFKNVGGPCLLLQIDIRYDRSSFAVTSRSIWVQSCRIVNICYTL